MQGSTTGPGLSVRPDPSLDLSLADLVERVLPLSHYYVRIVKFIELRQHYEFGWSTCQYKANRDGFDVDGVLVQEW